MLREAGPELGVDLLERTLPVVLSVLFLAVVLTFAIAPGRVPVVRPPIPKIVVPVGGHLLKDTATLSVIVGNVPRALDAVREEQTRTRAERDAFDTFVAEVEAIPASEELSMVGDRTAVVRTAVTTEDRCEEVREAYEETVMAVAHYREEYDDTVTESMAGELGPDVTAAVASGRTLTPVLKEGLLHAATQCRDERETFLTTLETERTALGEARETLETVARRLEGVTTSLPSERSLEEIIETVDELDEAERDCEALIDERQHQRTDGHASIDAPRSTLPDLCAYLYQPLPVTYPVLADATDLLVKLRRTRRQLLREFSARF